VANYRPNAWGLHDMLGKVWGVIRAASSGRRDIQETR